VKCKADRNECLAEAGEQCPRGYTVLSEDSHPGGAAADYLPGPVTWYTMLVRCKSDARGDDRDAPSSTGCARRHGTYQHSYAEQAGGTCGLMASHESQLS